MKRVAVGMTRANWASVLVGAALIFSGVVVAIEPSAAVLPARSHGAQASSSPAAALASPVTKNGSGAFAGLSVTVDQTTNLIHQVVPITWTGGASTPPGIWSSNYLQIMQCWGDDPSGPRPDQCEFGGNYGIGQGGSWVATRQLSYGSQVCDPIERAKWLAMPSPVDICHDGLTPLIFEPFSAVNGTVTSGGNTNQFFDSYSSNDQPLNRTYTDGTGISYFEMQTSREAPGLGCGAAVTDPVTAVTASHACWLVVVPRGATELLNTVGGPTAVQSSPLSATNWADRIVFPLSFQPIGSVCPIGAKERHTFGQEQIAPAMLSWQPALCQNNGTVFGYSQVSDDLARGQISGGAEALGFVSAPLQSSSLPSGVHPVYAPVAISAVGVSFLVEQVSPPSTPPSHRFNDGLRIPEIKLNPRLVAKLLTQSYRTGGFLADPKLTYGAYDLTRDPEFLALNPIFKSLYYVGIGDFIVPYIPADSTSLLWAWVARDPDAQAFLAGKPDPYGMTVNPVYKRMSIPRPDFPKQDPFCISNNGSIPQCTLEAHAYGNGLDAIASGVSRGDPLNYTALNYNTAPPSWGRTPPQLPGQVALLGYTGTPFAERYSLAMASLENTAGNYVAPTQASMADALTVMKKDAGTGVLTPNPAAAGSDGLAYPLTMVTYAVTNPAADSALARADYATFLEYAAGPGQVPGLLQGQLPPGYLPLPPAMQAQTYGVALGLLNYTTPTPSSSPSVTATPTRSTFTTPPASPSPTFAGSSPSSSNLPSVTATSTGASLPTVSVSAGPVAYTPPQPVGVGKWSLVLVLVMAGLALPGGSLLLTLSSRGRG